MNRRSAMKLIGAAGAGLAAGAPLRSLHARGEASTKKGWCGGDTGMHKYFGASWYYNWGARGGSGSAEFVPMIKGRGQLSAGNFNHIKKLKESGKAKYLLGYNEPERAKQGNLSVQEGLDHWPKLEAVGLPLGSPAPSSDGPGMAWLEEFMEQADRRKYRVDFIAMHWYRSANADEFEDFIERLYKTYRRPIWITEFNGRYDGNLGNDADAQEDFLKDALRFLERSRRVERYAFFNTSPGQPHSLLSSRNPLTPNGLGDLYRDI